MFPFPALHVAIDVQRRYLVDLSPDRRQSFPQNIRAFADKLRPYIPTIWVGWGDYKHKISPRLEDWPNHKTKTRASSFCHRIGFGQVKSLGLEDVSPLRDETIFEKSQVNPFDNGLKNEIKPYTDTVIITGMRTTACVYEAIRGALIDELKVIIVYDLLADNEANQKDPDPDWHLTKLTSGYHNVDRYANVSFKKSEDIFHEFCHGQIPPPIPAAKSPVWKKTLGL